MYGKLLCVEPTSSRCYEVTLDEINRREEDETDNEPIDACSHDIMSGTKFPLNVKKCSLPIVIVAVILLPNMMPALR